MNLFCVWKLKFQRFSTEQKNTKENSILWKLISLSLSLELLFGKLKEGYWNFNFHTQNWNLRAMSGSFSTVFPPLKNKDNSKHRLANKFYQPFLLTWIKVMEKPPAHFLTHLSLKAFHFLNVENWGNIFSFSRALEIKKLKKWSTTKITGKIQRIFMVEMINWGLSVNDVLFNIIQFCVL